MAAETISLELDAYERLRSARLHPTESFSSVVRRANWARRKCTGHDLLEFMRQRAEAGDFLSAETLDRLEAAQGSRRRSSSHW